MNDGVDLSLFQICRSASDERLKPANFDFLLMDVNRIILAKLNSENAGHDLGKRGDFLAILAVIRDYNPQVLFGIFGLANDVRFCCYFRRWVEGLRVIFVDFLHEG